MPPPSLVVREEDQAAEAAYQATLGAVYRESEEDERRRAAAVEEEEAAYEAAMALSAASDCVLPPVTPPSPVKAEPELESSPIERYSWTGVVREWVRAPPVLVGATPKQEAAYLEHWRHIRLAEERRDGEYLEMLERDAEAEEEARQAATLPAPAQPTPDMAVLWNTAFGWAGPAPTLIDPTDPKDDDDDAS